jgi:TusA-related sulfurtransferase
LVPTPSRGHDLGPLDLRGTPCPLNLIRARLTLETLPPNSALYLDLDRGEAEHSVTAGLRTSGHSVLVQPHPEDPEAVRLVVRCDDAS